MTANDTTRAAATAAAVNRGRSTSAPSRSSSAFIHSGFSSAAVFIARGAGCAVGGARKLPEPIFGNQWGAFAFTNSSPHFQQRADTEHAVLHGRKPGQRQEDNVGSHGLLSVVNTHLSTPASPGELFQHCDHYFDPVPLNVQRVLFVLLPEALVDSTRKVKVCIPHCLCVSPKTRQSATHFERSPLHARQMSWAEPADMDTLSELPTPSVSVGKVSNLSRGSSSSAGGGIGRSSKSARRVGGGASKSERRLLMEAKAGVGAAIAEVRDPAVGLVVGYQRWMEQRSIITAGQRWTRERWGGEIWNISYDTLGITGAGHVEHICMLQLVVIWNSDDRVQSVQARVSHPNNEVTPPYFEISACMMRTNASKVHTPE